MVQRCACVLLAEYQSRHQTLPVGAITAALNGSQLLSVEQTVVEKTVITMMERGSYYRNLENALGAGATLALGTEIGETTWTKALGKSGRRFDATMDHLKRTALARLAQDYSELRIHLVAHQLRYLQSCENTYIELGEASFDVLANPQQWATDVALSADLMLECIHNPSNGGLLASNYWEY